jgi:hypothetical protein
VKGRRCPRRRPPLRRSPRTPQHRSRPAMPSQLSAMGTEIRQGRPRCLPLVFGERDDPPSTGAGSTTLARLGGSRAATSRSSPHRPAGAPDRTILIWTVARLSRRSTRFARASAWGAHRSASRGRGSRSSTPDHPEDRELVLSNTSASIVETFAACSGLRSSAPGLSARPSRGRRRPRAPVPRVRERVVRPPSAARRPSTGRSSPVSGARPPLFAASAGVRGHAGT